MSNFTKCNSSRSKSSWLGCFGGSVPFWRRGLSLSKILRLPANLRATRDGVELLLANEGVVDLIALLPGVTDLDPVVRAI